MTGCSEIAACAMSQAQTDDNLSKMSNAINNMEAKGEAVLDTDNKKADIKMGSVSDCITIEILSDATDDNLTILFGDASGDSKCIHLQSAIDVAQYPMKLRGANVTY